MNKAKQPLVALLLSFLVPGLGHIYNLRFLRGVIFFLLITFSGVWVVAYIVNPATKVSAFCVIPALASCLALIYCYIDSYSCVKKYNLSQGLNAAITARAKLLLVAAVIAVPLLNFLTVTQVARYINSHLYRVCIMPPDSMEPTIYRGEYVLVSLGAYKKAIPQRGDVVLYIPPGESTSLYLHRIVGFSGESVELKDGKIMINGAKLSDGWALKVQHYNGGKLARRGMKPIVVPADYYYMLGDSAARSRDSRYFGPVAKGCVLGKAYKIIYPFNRSGSFQ